MKKLLLALTCLTPVALAATAGDEKAKIDGTWLLTSAVRDGTKFPEEELKKAMPTGVFKDGKYTLMVAGKVQEAGTYKVDATKKPATIDLMITEGDPADKGKTQLGIFKIEGDTLTFAVGAPGNANRPKNFDGGKDVELQTMKRKK
jgi:uncharacterized protein (TIGR03067 family)